MSETFGMIRHMSENTHKKKGWFSRRHETDEAHRAASHAYSIRALNRQAALGLGRPVREDRPLGEGRPMKATHLIVKDYGTVYAAINARTDTVSGYVAADNYALLLSHAEVPLRAEIHGGWMGEGLFGKAQVIAL